MAEKSSTAPARLVEAVYEQLRRQGYAATSMKQAGAAAKVSNGSLYHHFPAGKPQIAAIALREAGAAYLQLFALLMADHDDLAEAVDAAFSAAAAQVEAADWITMCPVVSVATEVADTVPELRQVGADIIAEWIDQGSLYFADRGMPRERAREFTIAMLSALEGAFALSRVLHSAEPLRTMGRMLAVQAGELSSAASN